jgi:hypothetical protein
MSSPIFIAQEIDQLQKKLDLLKDIDKLYPDTIINDRGFYENRLVNKEANNIRFVYEKSIVWAWLSKSIEGAYVYTTPFRFGVLMYDPQSLYTKLMIQQYREDMIKWDIQEDMIRKTDLYVIDFMNTKRKISLKDTNLDTLNNDNLKKLLVLL